LRDALKHIAHKRYDMAIKALNMALDADPREQEAKKWLLVCRARKLMEEGKRDEAVAFYRELIGMDRNHYEATREIGAFQKEKTLKAVPFGRYFIKSSRSASDAPGGRPRKKSDS
jgi:tetratricopeptide (TPR) repeat protein